MAGRGGCSSSSRAATTARPWRRRVDENISFARRAGARRTAVRGLASSAGPCGRRARRASHDRGAAQQRDFLRVDARRRDQIGRIEDEQRPVEDEVLEADRAVVGDHEVGGGE